MISRTYQDRTERKPPTNTRPPHLTLPKVAYLVRLIKAPVLAVLSSLGMLLLALLLELLGWLELLGIEGTSSGI